MISNLRERIPLEEFDYQALTGALDDYARPRDKITTLLNRGIIIRVKKGLYIFGSGLRKRPYSREILANLIYGPSCVSREYALAYHGLIPEQVETITSVTSKRNKTFTTPLGVFDYRALPPAGFPFGIIRIELADGSAFLLAGSEKALADKLYCEHGLSLTSAGNCLDYLTISLRIDMEALRTMDADLLDQLARNYRSRRVKLLADCVRRLAGKDSGNE